jgi:mono/diheme cytochrome c family protein
LSRRELRARWVALLVGISFTGLAGCWEQWSESWFPQMKWQKAVQAYERVSFRGRDEGFLPPEGAVPIQGRAPSYAQFDPGADSLQNPTQPGDLATLKRGQVLYQSYCQTCHGSTGMGDGPVSMASKRPGPFAGVFPLVTAMSRSDGYIFNLIRNGGTRMPSYKRIPDHDRWLIVNYVRYLQKGGRP